MGFLAALPAILGAGGGILSSLGIGNNPAEWRQNAAVSGWNANNQGIQNSLQNLYNPYADSLRNNLASNTDAWGQTMQPWGAGLYDSGEAQYRNIADFFNNSAMNYSPNSDSQWFTKNQANLANDMTGAGQTARDLFMGGGWTPQYQQGFDSSGAMMNGQDPTQQGLKQSALDIMQSGGYSPGTNQLFNAGQRALQGDPSILAAQQRGMQLAGTNPLLTPEAASNYAGELAQRGLQQQGKKVYRDASNRGGGPGAVMGSGSENQMLADFADDTSRATTDARMQALLSQQGLGLQQQQNGMGLLNSGNTAANQLFGTGVGALQGGENAATSRLGVGGNLAQTALGNQLGYGNLFNSMMGNQNQYALGAGNLMNSIYGTQSNMSNLGFQNNLANGQLNLDYINGGTNRGNAMAGQSNNAYGNWNGAYNSNLNGYNQGNQQLGDMARAGLNYASGYVNNMPSILNAMVTPGNQQAGIDFGGLASGAGGLAGGIQNAFKR